MSQPLNISIIQPNIVWEDKAANLAQYEQFIEGIGEKKEVVILPEMFTTGFSMNAEALAETMDGPTVQWMKDMAKKHRCILTGSLIIREEDKIYNRLIWMQPDGNYGVYDKRHLFGYAHEDEHYTAGDKRLIAQVKGWKICLMVCYDLRFPVWARNLNEDYDLLIYVANWPERRSLAWKTLLQARAIENMSYVAGVNRVGKDGKDINYTGDSAIIGPLGEKLFENSGDAVCMTITLDKNDLNETRKNLPFLKDADKFVLL